MNDPGGTHVRLGGDALHSTSKRCHTKTDGESRMTGISTPFSLEFAPLVFYVATMYTNQIEATMLRVDSTNEKAGYNPLIEAEGQTRLN